MPSSPRPPPITEEDEAFAAWPLLVCIGVTKLITIVVLFVNVRNQEALLLTLATLLPWFGVSIALLAAPVAWYWRMHRARRRRDAMFLAEWRSGAAETSSDTPVDLAPTQFVD